MISIIMPTYNRFDIAEESILKTLSIKSNVAFELLVVNDGDELPFKISDTKLTILKNPSKGVTSARNFGAKNAKYPILFFIDDDMWITASTLELIMSLYNDKLLVENYFNLNWIYPQQLQDILSKQKIGRYLLNSKYHTLEGRAKITIDYSCDIMDMDGLGSCSFCILKGNFLKVGGYNEDIEFQGEDIEMAIRLKEYKIYSKLATKITCFHNQKDRLDIDVFLDRYKRGFESQFKALAQKKLSFNVNPFKKAFFFILIPLFPFFKMLYSAIPNKSSFDKITFRLIGILSSIIYFKAFKQSTKNYS